MTTGSTVARPETLSSRLLSAIASYPLDAPPINAELARMVQSAPTSVTVAIRRLRAKGLWPWEQLDGRPANRERVKGARVHKAPKRTRMRGPFVEPVKLAIVHGHGSKLLDKGDAAGAVRAMLAAFRSRSRAELHKAVFGGIR